MKPSNAAPAAYSPIAHSIDAADAGPTTIDLESDLSSIVSRLPAVPVAAPITAAQAFGGRSPATRHSPPPAIPIRCSYTTIDGRRCRSLSEHADAIFCANHARIARRNPDLDTVCPTCHRSTYGSGAGSRNEDVPPDLAKELFGSIEDFQTTASINHALGRLAILQARNRIPVRNAAVLAYTFQLLLQTIRNKDSELRAEPASTA